MTISKFRGFLYTLSKFLGDIQAVKSKRKGSIKRRVGRRVAGKVSGKIMKEIFK